MHCPWSSPHLKPNVLCDSLIMSSYLTEEKNEVRREPLSEGYSRDVGFGLFFWCLPSIPFSKSISCPFSLVSSLPCHVLPCLSDPHPVGRQVLWLTGCRCVRPAVFWGLFGKSGYWLSAHGAGSTVVTRVDLCYISLNHCLYLRNREQGLPLLGRQWRRWCLKCASDLAPGKYKHPALRALIYPCPSTFPQHPWNCLTWPWVWIL